jgi:hypothetical protein
VTIVWDKGYTRQGVTRFFGQDFLGKLPRHAKEHADGSLSAWTRTAVDPDDATMTLVLPNCAGGADTATACTGITAATNAPVWVLDKTGAVRVVIVATAY